MTNWRAGAYRAKSYASGAFARHKASTLDQGLLNMTGLTAVTQSLIDISVGKRYLEITRFYDGASLPLSSNTRVVVAQEISQSLADDQAGDYDRSCVIKSSSDEFFFAKSCGEKFDVILLDGLHTFEQTYRDLQNALICLSDGGSIIIDDIMPNSYLASLPDISAVSRIRRSENSPDQSWMGDVYKLASLIDGYFQQFSFATVKETGRQLILWRAKRLPSVMRALKLESICRLSYADILGGKIVFNIMPLAQIVTAVRDGVSVLAADQSPASDEIIETLPAHQLSVKNAAWSHELIGAEGRRLIAAEAPVVLPELRCTNAELLSTYAMQSYTEFNAKRELVADAINAYALENVTLLPHGALLVDGKAVEEPLGRIAEELFRKDVINYCGRIRSPDIDRDDCKTIQGPVIVIEQPGMFNYGHVLIEMIPKLLPFIDHIRSGSLMVALQSKYQHYNFILSLLSFLGVGKEAIYWYDIESDGHIIATKASRLIYVSPITKHVYPSYKSPWGIDALCGALSSVKPARQKKLFISRKDASARQLVNEDDIFSIFAERGYERICTGPMSFTEQVAAFKGATHVVGVYGASLTNIVFCEPGSATWVLCPSNSVDSFYWELAAARDVAYLQTVGRPVPGQETDRNCDFEMEEQDILRAIDDFDRD